MAATPLSFLARHRSLLLGAALASSTVACSGLSPGDYRVYRIAFQQTQRTPDCFGAGQVPIDVQDDSSNQYVSGTFTIYMGADETVYLDTGAITLRGTEQGDEQYVFDGNDTDVEVDGNDPPTTTTRSAITNVTFAIDGQVVEGTYNESTSFDCSGPNCPDPAASSCSESTPFVGGEIEDVEIQHEV